MNIPHPILILSFLFLFNPPLASTETCLDSVCQLNEPIIRFPFHIDEKQQENTCGYPGFKLFCNEKGQTLLTQLELKIQKINYATQELFVNDPNNCLPKRLLSLNFSNSPYDAVYYQYFSFFNCSSNLESLTSRYKPIACLSDFSKYAVFATTSRTVFVYLSSVCELVDTVKVPVKSPLFHQVLTDDLSGDLRLSWNSPSCGRCESHGGRCGFHGNNTFELACYNVPPRKGISRGARYVIAICLGVPALLCFTALLSCICSRFRIGTDGWVWVRGTVLTDDFESLIVSREYTSIISGLDKPTIESYPKIVIGDQGRLLLEHDDETCPICLSDYMPKETVKTIPECGHCFHAQCIDQWLPLNASCPICRTSPPKSLPPQPLARS